MKRDVAARSYRAPVRAIAAYAALLLFVGFHEAANAGVPVHPSHASVYVAGKAVKFEKLGLAYNDPVASVNDPGLHAMLDVVGAQLSWQPGTRFVVVTRADGALITLTVGSSALSLDGRAVAMPFAPFYQGDELYVPILPLAKSLRLAVRGFKGGYVLVPQVVSISAHSDARRTIVAMTTSAPAAYRSDFDSHRHVLSISFPGFGTDSRGTFPLSGRDGVDVETSESGPPGFPTTKVAISVKRGVHFAAHRTSSALAVEAVLSRNQTALHLEDTTSSVGKVTRANENAPAPHANENTPAPRAGENAPAPAPSAVPSATPMASPVPAQSPRAQLVVPALVPTAHPIPVALQTATPVAPATTSPSPPTSPAASAQPNASPGASASNASPGTNPPIAEPTEAGSPSPTPTPAEIRITDVALNEIPGGGTRVTLTLNGGPVAFEWHRLADPDNRFWIDISGVTLTNPSQTLTSALPFVKDIHITQFSLEPERIVRIAIEPAQPIDVNIGAIAGSSNQMGIQIERTQPAPDAPKAGVGTIAFATPPPPVRTATQRDLIAIDPGHGGNDPGAMNNAYGLTESKLTLGIALRLRDALRRLGWRVVMTRDADYEVGDPKGDDHQELQARCDVANAAGARVFVSVHINSSLSRSLNGTTTYYWRSSDRVLAQAIQNALVTADGINSMGVRREQFYVINHTDMPAALVETAFLSNPHDAALLQAPSFLDKLANGIAKGIMDYTGGPQAPL